MPLDKLCPYKYECRMNDLNCKNTRFHNTCTTACIRTCTTACIRTCTTACIRTCTTACIRTCTTACIRTCTCQYEHVHVSSTCRDNHPFDILMHACTCTRREGEGSKGERQSM